VSNRYKPHQKYYLRDGTEVPGVTTVLGVMAKPALIRWANQQGLKGIDTTKYVDSMAAVGTLAHAMIEAHLTGETADTSDYSHNQIDLAENAVLSYLSWEKGHDLRVIRTEAQLVSEDYRFGGTIDCYGVLDGVPTLVDFKTSKAIYDEHLYQVSAYAALLEEHDYVVDRIMILQVGRDETEGFSTRTLDDWTHEFHIFQCSLNLYRALRSKR